MLGDVIHKLIKSGRSPKQAVAIALSNAERRAAGGYLAGQGGSPINNMAIPQFVPQRVADPQAMGINAAGFMNNPQVAGSPWTLDQNTGALSQAAQDAQKALAMRGSVMPKASAGASEAIPGNQVPGIVNSFSGREGNNANGGFDIGGPQMSGLERDAAANIANGGPMASGGGVNGDPWYERSEAHGMIPHGLINSPVGGRTDHIPMSLASNSYVIPADVVSGIGQGNTMAGAHKIDGMFAGGPFGTSLPSIHNHSTIPHPSSAPRLARGGVLNGVKVIVAGGEYIVPPEDVRKISKGDVTHGHAMLDEWVQRTRSGIVKKMKSLPGPVK